LGQSKGLAKKSLLEELCEMFEHIVDGEEIKDVLL
jgi:hypothetical protein